jgi:hypothetical protein
VFGEAGSGIAAVAVVGPAGRFARFGWFAPVGFAGWIAGGFVGPVRFVAGIEGVGRFGVGWSQFGSIKCQVQDRPKNLNQNIS